MITVYKYNELYIHTGETKSIHPSEGLDRGWTRTPPPEVVPVGKLAQFDGDSGWFIVEKSTIDVEPNIETYKKELLDGIDNFFARNAEENEFRSVEEAIESYERNDERWVSNLLADWRAKVKMDVRHHINDVNDGTIPVPNDLSFIDTLTDFDLYAVPFKVTARQAREALINQSIADGDDKIALVESHIDAIVDVNQQRLARNYWETSQDFERGNVFLNAIATDALGYTQTQIDDLFRYAQTL